MSAQQADAVTAPQDEAPVVVPEPCNYSAPHHDTGPTHYYAPGWRCLLHTPGAISRRHDQAGAS